MAILKSFEQNESSQIMEEKPETTTLENIIGHKKDTDETIGIASYVDKKSLVNITDLIRSVQRTEGNPDCFKKHTDGCDELECEWRPYCLDVLPTTE